MTYNKHSTKVVNGKKRIIYTKTGTNKQYIKNKGKFMSLSTYKKKKKGGGILSKSAKYSKVHPDPYNLAASRLSPQHTELYNKYNLNDYQKTCYAHLAHEYNLSLNTQEKYLAKGYSCEQLLDAINQSYEKYINSIREQKVVFQRYGTRPWEFK